MSGPIRFYFDFASPYAWFAAAQVDVIAEEFGRTVDWRPVLMWAVFQARGIPAPMESPARRTYFMRDIERSAAFFGLPYRAPVKLPLSSHKAARLYHHVRLNRPDAAAALARRVFAAFFEEQQDISDEATLAALAAMIGLGRTEALESMNGQAGRTLLEAAVKEATEAGVVGSPYFLVDGDGFFGADRLPQLRWVLAGGSA